MTTPGQIRAGFLPNGNGDAVVRRTQICDVPVDVLTMEESIAAARELIQLGGTHQHVAINAAKVVAARRNPILREILSTCAISNADGQSIVWASKLLGRRVPERVTGIDFMLRMWEVAAEQDYRVFLLGSKPGTVRKAADAARAQGVNVVGARSGYWTPEEEPDVVAEVAATRPDLLFVGLPTPRKEEFLHRHLAGLRASLAVGVGGSFDVVAGEVSRAPAWMQQCGLEWLHRMRQEPRRLFGRYARANLEFITLVARDWYAGRRRSRT